MKRLIPHSLAGQLIALVLIALIASQIVIVSLMIDERQSAIRSSWLGYAYSRIAAMAELIDATPAHLHEQILKASSTRVFTFEMAGASAVTPQDMTADARRQAATLRTMLPRRITEVRVNSAEPQARLELLGHWVRQWLNEYFASDPQARREARWQARITRLEASLRMADGQWLNVRLTRGNWAPPLWLLIVPMLTVIAVLGSAMVLIIRRITRPLKRLADAASAFGRGETVAPLPESGTLELRSTIAAFNQMRERLSRFVLDRTKMLAAIGHDLRTPITSLRLRAEFIEDEETRTKILETLDEMHHMVEAALAFAREESAEEPTRLVDLGALVQSVCADLADMDRDVICEDAPKLPIRCRPNSLKRAVRNLVENAVIHGKLARVRLGRKAGEVDIVIEDIGPGIAEADLPRVFSPFVRLDAARGRNTGGIGLGLAIARSIVRGHGGDILLSNLQQGGLRAAVRLPYEG